MNNFITVNITFSFKGETFTPSVKLDLDTMMKNYHDTVQGRELESLYPLLAASIDLDTYSYAYEILQASDALYSDASELAQKHLQDGDFNYQSFYSDWTHHKHLDIIASIAQTHLDIDDLQQQPALRDALLEALEAGKTL